MKKILFAAGISILGLSAVYAQNMQKKAAAQTQTSNASSRSQQTRNPEQIAEMKTARLDKEVGMTADQKKKIYDIFLKEAQENQGRAALRQETNTQVKGILTAEQNQKLEARQAERKEMMMQRKQTVRDGNLQASPAKQ
ncbi:hypothetical protein [Taibaiella chishuiensis]|uniref:Spy/CpxP family protein refolding chaperone n=1 Tax=Taibaiella chishuiensis TaxID=1434707 RepID=A0A2P8CSS9_9BACT|nr:hypothetical protein [Taibaiella chishuiensis]PSK88023.1 hypothetical protein B0I18_11654 [Taibaiella chishuiensis]